MNYNWVCDLQPTLASRFLPLATERWRATVGTMNSVKSASRFATKTSSFHRLLTSQMFTFVERPEAGCLRPVLTSTARVCLDDQHQHFMFTVNTSSLADERFNDVTSLGDSERRHYFTGSCSDVIAQNHIRSTYLSILRTHDMSRMCESERFQDDCVEENVQIVCG